MAVPIRLRREQWSDPRWACLSARPHPLPRSAWLNRDAASGGAVLDLVPSARGGRRAEWLRFVAPVGAVSLRVVTEVPFTAVVDGREIPAADGLIDLDKPLAPGTVVHLRFDAANGHSGGGLLSGAIQARTERTPAGLAEWEELGLGSFGGYVSYRRTIHVDQPGPGDRSLLDLGASAAPPRSGSTTRRPATLAWSPYRAEITAHLQPGNQRSSRSLSAARWPDTWIAHRRPRR